MSYLSSFTLWHSRIADIRSRIFRYSNVVSLQSSVILQFLFCKTREFAHKIGWDKMGRRHNRWFRRVLFCSFARNKWNPLPSLFFGFWYFVVPKWDSVKRNSVCRIIYIRTNLSGIFIAFKNDSEIFLQTK